MLSAFRFPHVYRHFAGLQKKQRQLFNTTASFSRFLLLFAILPLGRLMPVPFDFNPERWTQSALSSRFLAGPRQDFCAQILICLFLHNRDFTLCCHRLALFCTSIARKWPSARLQERCVSALLNDYEVPTPPVAD